MRCFSGSSIRNCTFVCSENRTDLLSIVGANIEVVGCRFGPCYGLFPILRAYTQGNCRIEDCVFEGIERSSSLIEINMDCPGPEGVPITIRGNRFLNYHGVSPAQGTTAIRLLPQDQSYCYFGVIEENEFRDGSSILTSGIRAGASVDLVGNTFQDLGPDPMPNVYASGLFVDTIHARYNSYLEPGIAAESSGPYFDVRENWWGDSTGPNHANLNPEGQGTPVGNGVLFIPWLTMHPDSLPDTNGVAVDDLDLLLPNEYAITVYPNPFNATTTLTIEVVTSGIYEVILYDLTGRETTRLFSGRIEFRRSLQVNAEGFASGVYFARLSNAKSEVAVTKLLLLK